jgi:hypothetical protein
MEENVKQEVNKIISEVDEKGLFEKKNDPESFKIEKLSDNYKVTVFDSETDKNSGGKVYYFQKTGLEEYLTAMTTEADSILNRL